jgi:hypothetical protein
VYESAGSLMEEEKSARFWSASAPAALLTDRVAVLPGASVPCFRHQEFQIRRVQFAAHRASFERNAI